MIDGPERLVIGYVAKRHVFSLPLPSLSLSSKDPNDPKTASFIFVNEISGRKHAAYRSFRQRRIRRDARLELLYAAEHDARVKRDYTRECT